MGKSINIKNEKAVALLEELKAATGKGATELLIASLEEAVERQRKLATVEERIKKIDAIVERMRGKFPKNMPSIDEIVGYGPDGLPE